MEIEREPLPDPGEFEQNACSFYVVFFNFYQGWLCPAINLKQIDSTTLIRGFPFAQLKEFTTQPLQCYLSP